jgi:hypothetical protein
MIARWMIAGFVLWAIVMAGFNFALSSSGASMPWLFLTLPIVMFALTFLLFKVFKVDESDRAEAASIFCVPGMLIGIYLIQAPKEQIFTNLTTPKMNVEFASLLFATYAAIILAGIVFSRLQKTS